MPQIYQPTINLEELISNTDRFFPQRLTNILLRKVGSRFTETDQSRLLTEIRSRRWFRMINDHLDQRIVLGCEGWQAGIPGEEGFVVIEKLPKKAKLFWGEKSGGLMHPVTPTKLEQKKVAWSTLLVARHKGQRIIATIHPGDPFIEPTVKVDGRLGKSLTRKECADEGFVRALLVTEKIQETA